MSRQCSQVAIWRVLALSTTLTSLVLWNPTPLCIYLREAATLSQPSGVPDLSLWSPGHGSQGGISRSCRAPGFPDSGHLAATPPDGGVLFPWWLHYDGPVAAVLNAYRSPGWEGKGWPVFSSP